MQIEIEITGIRKDNGNHYNPHEAVAYYRWVDVNGKTGITDRTTVVGWLEWGINGTPVTAYVHRVNPLAYCDVKTSAAGTKFLQSRSDDTSSNNILNLPEC